MNNNNRANEHFEGILRLDEYPVTGAIVVKGKCGLLVRFLNEAKGQDDIEVVYVRISPGRLYIVGEDGR